jgi:tetratricopeptide (TPR) repeat protein
MSTNRYKQLLSDHLRFLERSAIEFDRGDIREALRIATSLRVIFHQTTKSKALLEHLNAWSIMLRTETAKDLKDLPAPVFMADWSSSPDTNVSHDNAEYLSVKEWWEEYPVAATSGIWITRKDIVLWAANKDGGAHVDDILPATYTKALQGMTFTGPDKKTGEILPREIITPFYKLRQFAYEVLHSTDLLELADKFTVEKPDYAIIWYNKGYDLYIIGRYKKALNAFNRSLKTKPDNAMVLHFKGLALNNLGRHREALDASNKALQINPNNGMTWHLKGLVLGHLTSISFSIYHYVIQWQSHSFYNAIERQQVLR